MKKFEIIVKDCGQQVLKRTISNEEDLLQSVKFNKKSEDVNLHDIHLYARDIMHEKFNYGPYRVTVREIQGGEVHFEFVGKRNRR